MGGEGGKIEGGEVGSEGECEHAGCEWVGREGR